MWRPWHRVERAPVHRGRALAWFAIGAFALLAWFAVPHGIGASWRECDTQAIARNFLVDGFDPLRPRVDWRGDTDGAVECEFPLYQLATASLLGVFGVAFEWPGRLLSLLAMMWAAWSLHRLLEQRCGAAGALAGLLAFLASGSTMMLATRVMPDAFSLLLAVASLAAFVQYLGSGSSRTLALSMAALACAGLQKPLALQIGWVMFGWTAVLAPSRLREPRLWLGWGLVVAVVVAWLLHASSLHAETGLSFGVVSGGDTKFPGIAQLLSPRIHAHLGWTTVQYGFGPLGIIAAVSLLLSGRADRADVVLLGAVVVGLYLSLRYSYHERMGPHYHMFAAVAGAFCVARLFDSMARPFAWLALLLSCVLLGGYRLHVERDQRNEVLAAPVMELAARIRGCTEPDERIVVRSRKNHRDPVWQRRHNFEDPTLLYQAGLQGWVLACDAFGVDRLERLRERGARLVFDCIVDERTPSQRWLQQNADLLLDSPHGRLHRLRSAP